MLKNDMSNVDNAYYQRIYDKVELLFGLTADDCIKVNYKGREALSFNYENIYMLFWEDKDDIKMTSFVVDDNNRICSFSYDGDQVDVGNNFVRLVKENGNIECLYLLKNSDEPQFDVSSNGIVVYMQYNLKNDTRLVLKYEYNVYQECDDIYNYRLKNPFLVVLENKTKFRDKGLKFLGRKDSFYRLDFDIYNNGLQYEIATLKEFGVGALIAHSAISLQNGESKFSKYYRTLFTVGDYITITGFPFLKQYDSEVIESLIEGCGFNVGVPGYMLDLYKKRNSFSSELEEVVNSYLTNNKILKK